MDDVTYATHWETNRWPPAYQEYVLQTTQTEFKSFWNIVKMCYTKATWLIDWLIDLFLLVSTHFLL